MVEIARLTAEQLEQVTKARASGLVVREMTEQNELAIGRLAGYHRDEMVDAFRFDAHRLATRVRSSPEPNFMYYASDVHLHAHDLAVAGQTQHQPADPELVGLIWQKNDPDIDLSHPWPAVLTASGRLP